MILRICPIHVEETGTGRREGGLELLVPFLYETQKL